MKLLENMNVLVVEDEALIRKTVRSLVERLGASEVFSAGNGVSALKFLKERKVDLIVSDWEMPLLSGLKLLQTVRSDKALKDKKFIMLTGANQKEAVLQAAKLGVDNYIVKPISIDVLAGKIRSCLDDNGLSVDLYHLEIGDISQEQGNIDLAIREYSESIKLNPDNPEAHLSMGEAQQKKGDFSDALTSLTRSISLNNRSARAHFVKSRVHINLHQQKDARDEFEVAIELDPKDLKRCTAVAHAFLEKGFIEDATSAFKLAIDMDPKDVVLHNKMGIALRKSGKAGKAIEQYKMALKIKPDDPTLLFNMSKAYLSNEQLPEAKKVLKEALQAAPDFNEARELLSSL